ncbi:hypothetical protein BsWGS_20207 [Bradybaena similaris]
MSTLKLRGYYPTGENNKGKESLSDAVLKRIAARCPNLQVLHLLDCHTKNISFESLPSSIVCLEMVNCVLELDWMNGKGKHLPKLEHLNLDSSWWVDDSLMIDISEWRNLKYLSISKCYMVSNEGVEIIADNLHELEYLNICGTNIDDEAVVDITQDLKKLRQLCISYCHGVSDEGIVQIATQLPVLNKLDISHCVRVTMRGLEALIGGSIRELVAVGFTELSNKDKRALKRSFAVTHFR